MLSKGEYKQWKKEKQWQHAPLTNRKCSPLVLRISMELPQFYQEKQIFKTQNYPTKGKKQPWRRGSWDNVYDLKAPRLTQLSVGHFIEHRLGIKISATSHSIDVNQHPEVIQKMNISIQSNHKKHVCSANYQQSTKELQQIKPRKTHLNRLKGTET